MNSSKKPSLSDNDIITRQEKSKAKMTSSPIKMGSMAVALMISTAAGTLLTSCSDNSDCDSDVTRSGDPARTARYDSYDPYDYGGTRSDSDVSSTRDAKICD